MKAVPFLVLAKAMQDVFESDTEERRRTLRMVEDVCMAIYKEGLGIKDDIMDAQGLDYLRGPHRRTLDIVPNSSAFTPSSCVV